MKTQKLAAEGKARAPQALRIMAHCLTDGSPRLYADSWPSAVYDALDTLQTKLSWGKYIFPESAIKTVLKEGYQENWRDLIKG